MSDQITLKDAFNAIRLRNRTGKVQRVLYDGGDSIDIMPLAIRTVPTTGLIQLPDTSLFQFISPTLAEIKALDLTAAGETPAANEGANTAEVDAAAEAASTQTLFVDEAVAKAEAQKLAATKAPEAPAVVSNGDSGQKTGGNAGQSNDRK